MRAPGTSFTTPCPSLVACLLRREGGAIPSIAMPPHGESERATTPPTRTGKRVIHPSHERGSAQGNDTVVGGGYIHDSTRHILQSVHWSAAACPGGRTRGSSPALLLAGAVLRAHRVRRSHGVVTGNWRAWGWRVSSRHQQMHLRWHHRSSRTLCTHAPGDVARPRSAADRGELLRIGSGSLRNKAAAKSAAASTSTSASVVCPSLLCGAFMSSTGYVPPHQRAGGGRGQGRPAGGIPPATHHKQDKAYGVIPYTPEFSGNDCTEWAVLLVKQKSNGAGGGFWGFPKVRASWCDADSPQNWLPCYSTFIGEAACNELRQGFSGLRQTRRGGGGHGTARVRGRDRNRQALSSVARGPGDLRQLLPQNEARCPNLSSLPELPCCHDLSMTCHWTFLYLCMVTSPSRFARRHNGDEDGFSLRRQDGQRCACEHCQQQGDFRRTLGEFRRREAPAGAFRKSGLAGEMPQRTPAEAHVAT